MRPNQAADHIEATDCGEWGEKLTLSSIWEWIGMRWSGRWWWWWGDRAKLSVRLYKPAPREAAAKGEGEDIVVNLVHPYTILGAAQGLQRGMAEGVARQGRGPPAMPHPQDLLKLGKSSSFAAGSQKTSTHAALLLIFRL
uniref:Uncharacterized protein n=1 Tax=Leersia perrieri TaxID=77586 RepID=A0A0D9VK83_9ORYZ